MPKLTKRLVDALEPRGDRAYEVYDGELPVFALRVARSGRKVYALRYRTSDGKKRTLKLGQHGILTADQARKMALEALGEVARGGDPSEDRTRRRLASTVADLVERYRHEHLATKKPSTRARAEGLLERVILPALGNLKVEAVTRAEVLALHRAHREHPVEANRAVTLLSGLFTFAEDHGIALPAGNPCRRIKKHPEQRRERYLSSKELAALGVALAEAEREGTERAAAILAIRLLLLTGCRKGEILELRWEHVDIERGCLRLPDSKTGAKTVPLGAPALELLAKAAEKDRTGESPWVCPGARHGQPFKNLYAPWKRICERAGVRGVRPHDLRHSYVSVGASGGESLAVVGAIVGHSTVSMTERYAHLSDDPVRAAADRISGEIAAALSGGVGGEVEPLRKAR